MTIGSGLPNVPILRGLVGRLAGQELPVPWPRAVIGRDAGACDIVLEHAVVSRQHAVIEIGTDGHATITDLGSKTGTFVNGERISCRELRDGDRIGFGPQGLLAFRFQNPLTIAAEQISAQVLKAQFMEAAAAATQVGAARAIQNGSVARAHSRLVRSAVVEGSTPPLLRLGRAPDNEIVLDAPGVSRYHATLDYSRGNQPVLSDLGSTNGTFVNGEVLRAPRMVVPADVLFVGGYVVQVRGREIRRLDLSASRLIARQLRKEVDNGRVLLKDISFAIFPREFVGLVGPSGCGKTTLLNALNGFSPATSGTVLVNDLDLYRNFQSLRRSIGYVPQRDVLHEALTVERTLHYAARLRLPESTTDADVRRVVGEVVGDVGLRDQLQTMFGQLSGGQQKRLSLGLELITKPTFLFLDEPTSPLDPETTENLMMLFRRLADEGRIIVMVTHRFEKFEQMHQVAILTKTGRLAFFGPPREALQYFGCREPADIYRKIGSAEPDIVREKFLGSPEYRRYVDARIEQAQELGRAGEVVLSLGGQESRLLRERPGIHQWVVLTQRYLETKLKDRRNTLLLVLQAPVVALILAAITVGTTNDVRTLFIAGVMAIWFGANNAVREIVADLPIYRRERLVNLKIPSYVLSKFAVLSGFALIQCILFLAILMSLHRLRNGDFVPLLTTLYLTSLGGISTGLFLSALVTSVEKAMSMLPLILIPQLLLAGFLKPLEDVYLNIRTGRPTGAAAYEQFVSRGGETSLDPVKRNPGLGSLGYASGAIIARWTIDALAHTVSLEDEDARHRLPTQMTVRAYQRVLDGSQESTMRAHYRNHIALDLTLLGGFSVIFVGLTMAALKHKDVL